MTTNPPQNVVFILTDTFNKHHIGAYGCSFAHTPNLDRLATDGLRFDRVYPGSPLCTPARGCIFTGLHAASNGCTFNDATPYRQVPILGEVLRDSGIDMAYTGKWHIEGSGEYLGDGKADGGFPEKWWYDGRNYADDMGPEREALWRRFNQGSWDELLERAFPEKDCWATRLADRAIEFLEQPHDRPFFLCVSMDEPHGPFMSPREYLEQSSAEDFEIRPNVRDDLQDKPAWHRFLTKGHRNVEEDLRFFWRYYSACCTYTDAQIGRIVDAVHQNHGDDTLIVFTSDHGEQMGSHGCWGKGYMMYEESAAVPLIVSGPGVPRGASHPHPVSHLELFPTFLEALALPADPRLHGHSLNPVFENPKTRLREHVMIGHERFGNDGRPGVDHRPNQPIAQNKGEYFPIRCVVDDRYKLVINLLETDELYDHQEDPYEMNNRIGDPAMTAIRDRLHQAMLEEMFRTRDPLRGACWIDRFAS